MVFFKSSAVGAITVAPSDANVVVYVGMGEADMRSNISLVMVCINLWRKKRGLNLASIKRMQSLILNEAAL
jgi:hypothetical protein